MSESSKNKYQHNDDGTTFIFIETKNKYFPGKHTIIINTEDWDGVKNFKWSVHGNAASYGNITFMTMVPHPDGGWQVSTTTGIRRRRRTSLSLHQLILGKPERGMVVDHINRNSYDNRKENLRFATYSQNSANRKSRENSSSNYLGVSWSYKRKKWTSQLNHHHRQYKLGFFTCEHQAALAYNKKAIELHGEFAHLNVVPQEYVLKYDK